MKNAIFRYNGKDKRFLWKVIRISKAGSVSQGEEKVFDISVSEITKC